MARKIYSLINIKTSTMYAQTALLFICLTKHLDNVNYVLR